MNCCVCLCVCVFFVSDFVGESYANVVVLQNYCICVQIIRWFLICISVVHHIVVSE